MSILNTTFVVDPPAECRWLDWLRKVYMPRLAPQCTVAPRLLRIVESAAGDDHATYALQAEMPDARKAQAWLDGDGAQLLSQIQRICDNRVLYFSTILDDYPSCPTR